jgi:RNA polymerase sigma factor (sigma-70 family)
VDALHAGIFVFLLHSIGKANNNNKSENINFISLQNNTNINKFYVPRSFFNRSGVQRDEQYPPSKGGENGMKNQNSFEKRITGQFDSFCKKVLKNEVRDFYDEMGRQRKREKSISELSDHESMQLSVFDEYFSSEHIFEVIGLSVVVKGNELAEALHHLSKRRRDIVLLSYFLGKSDREIAEQLHMVRRTVSRQRNHTLKQLRRYIELEVN